MSDQSPPKDKPRDPVAPRGLEWGRRPQQIFHVGPLVGGPRLYSGQGGSPVRPVAVQAPAPSPRPSVLTGSLVPQRRAPAREAEAVRIETAQPGPERIPVAVLEPAPVVPEHRHKDALVEGPKRRRSRMGLYGLGAVVLGIMAVVAVLLLTRPSDRPEVEPVLAGPEVEPVAVAEPVAELLPRAVEAVEPPAPVAVARTSERTRPVPEGVVPEPEPVPAAPPQIRLAEVPAGPEPTPARTQSSDPDAPIITQPQPLDD